MTPLSRRIPTGVVKHHRNRVRAHQVSAARAALVVCSLALERRPEFGVGQLNVLRDGSPGVRVALSSPP
jgi:hypothetical protein